MFEISIFYSRLISFSPHYVLWARWAQSRPSAGGNRLKRRWLPHSWGSGWAFYNLPAPGRGTDSSLPSVRTDTVIKCPSQLSTIRGNFILMTLKPCLLLGACSKAPLPQISPPQNNHMKRETSDVALGELKWPAKHDAHDFCSVSDLKCGFLPWGGGWAAAALPA